MSLFGSLTTWARGKANEADENFQDTQAITILNQHIRDAETEAAAAERNLAKIMAQHSVAVDDVAKLDKEIVELTDLGQKAFDSGRADLADQAASRLSNLDAQKAAKQELADSLNATKTQLESDVRNAKQVIGDLKLQIQTVEATEQAQRAQAAVTKNVSGNGAGLAKAREALERKKESQRVRAHELKAAGTVGAKDDLMSELRSATATAKPDAASRFGKK